MLLSSCEQTLSRTAGNIEGEQERGQDDRKTRLPALQQSLSD